MAIFPTTESDSAIFNCAKKTRPRKFRERIFASQERPTDFINTEKVHVMNLVTIT